MARPKKQADTAAHPAPERSAAASADTPLMKQYRAVKAKYPGSLLLFRVGDFYETFGEDAVRASQILGITLTKRNNGAAGDIELAGFPHHALEIYLPRLVRGGARVAVCDQLEDPKLAKGIVKRGVTEIVTPGIALSDTLLDRKQSHYLCALRWQGNDVGAAFIDLSTGDFFCLSGSLARMEKVLYGLQPKEVVVARGDVRVFHQHFGEDFYLYRLDDWVFEPHFAQEHLLRHFRVQSLKGFGLDDDPLGATAAGVLLHYLQENEQRRLGHIARIYRFEDAAFVAMDRFTVRNLELLSPLHPDGKAFADVLDETATPMGARLLRRWISFPLTDRAAIAERLAAVQALTEAPQLLSELQRLLSRCSDLERLVAKLATGRINPRECVALRSSLQLEAPLREALGREAPKPFLPWLQGFADTAPALHLLADRLAEECPPNLNAGGVIRAGYSPELDELRNLKADAEGFLDGLRRREAERTGIGTLKISYNRVFGYYIEITNAHRGKVPPDYIRKQTLAGAERYVTPELKTFEERMLTAEERLLRLETELYNALVADLQAHLAAVQQNAAAIAALDVLHSFAHTARSNQYVRPEVTDDFVLQIAEGRHPVIERLLPRDAPYVPNDVALDPASRQIGIVTGPNMAGKSALLRQTALITLMAQMGSFVPARAAHVGYVDRIFTRVGASDNLAAGESTFMVEMNETARILNNATPRSLILLDEIGRGTSTYDGVSIAWAIVEYLHDNPGCAARTLFATHYHELAELAERLPRVHNFHVAVREIEGKILFLRKLLPGHSEHSFGIQVAEMAGMPRTVVQRARLLLEQFEAGRSAAASPAPAAAKPAKVAAPAGAVPQMNLFTLSDDVANRIRSLMQNVEIDRMTPVEALVKLQEIQKALRD